MKKQEESIRKNPPSYKSATWSCCCGSGSPDFLVCFLQALRLGAPGSGCKKGRGSQEPLWVRGEWGGGPGESWRARALRTELRPIIKTKVWESGSFQS